MTGAGPVGLVVVSHSRALARAAVAMAQEMLNGGQVPIEIAAGLDETVFGTDAAAIASAITTADNGAGVVVLMDLGSAVLSAELALELIDDAVRERVVLCSAPLVEGLVVATVAATAGADRAEVAAEAGAALAGKVSHLGTPQPTGPPPRPAATPDPGNLVATFTVENPHGLHARPAARLVREVRPLDAGVALRNATTGSGWIPASSLSKVATLGALRGHEIEVRASGPGARDALDRVLALAARRFDEVNLPVPTAASADRPVHPPGVERGDRPVGASPGVGIGPVWSPRPSDGPGTHPHGAPAGDPRAEWQRVEDAVDATRRAVAATRAAAAREVGAAEAAIFDAHLLLLDDTDLQDDVRARTDAGETAPQAWAGVLDQVEADLAALPDPYLRARAADVADVSGQVLRALAGAPAGDGDPVGVLVTAELTPAQAAGLDRTRVVAVVQAFGSPTAHSAILLRARGVPAVVGAGAGVLGVPHGTTVAVDGSSGDVIVDPSPPVRAEFTQRAAEFDHRHRVALAKAAAPATTRDGIEVLVGANVGSVEDAEAARGADLAGLVRTEFLFLGRTRAPDVDEQEDTYRRIAAALDGRRITLRTLDVGGDKPLGYLPMPAEANPFLGLRGVRLALARPELLAEQLVAMVRVAHDRPVSIMFPMISTLDELRRARRMLDDAVTVVDRGEPDGLQVGIMVEVPAAALKVRVLAPHVDFFSIGTNDLTQYTLAAERGNPAVAEVGDHFDPGVLLLVDTVCRGAGHAPVAVCGELAADERAAALLVGLGVRELSVSPRSVPAVKEAVRGIDSTAAAGLARDALTADSADSVRALFDTVHAPSDRHRVR